MSQDAPQATSPGGSDAGISSAQAILVVVAVTSLLVLGLLIWWIGVLGFIRWTIVLIGILLALSTVIAAAVAYDSAPDWDESEVHIVAGLFAGSLVCWILWYFLPVPESPLPEVNLELAAVTILGGWTEADMLTENDSTVWHGSAFVYESTESSLRLFTNRHCLGLDSLATECANDLDGKGDVQAYSLTIVFPSGAERDVTQIGVDPSRDIAWVEVSAIGLVAGVDYVLIPTAPRRSDPTVRPGDEVVAVGSPIDPGLQQTQTFGRVSAVRPGSGITLIQHDAPISPGNSGGPLFARRKNKLTWIGINTAGYLDGNSLGFAISKEDVLNATFLVRDASPSGACSLVREVWGVHATPTSH